ncbi:hypothetical protein KC19_12G056100 [Ceratodon purpureus]|uniref:Uncharacterized protein n=1 Tax=Ceratodon purpureus TaxID=3225 RepID=A0A8T0G545_CERPU|nr:hypothetical protein KC19_12G056100 [Ceratodon purpureus]
MLVMNGFLWLLWCTMWVLLFLVRACSGGGSSVAPGFVRVCG